MTASPTRPSTPQMSEAGPGTFVYEIRRALNGRTCEEMVGRFEQRTEQHYPGRLGQHAAEETSIKRSTDLRISGRAEWEDIDTLLHESLQCAIGALAKLHPFFAHNHFKDVGYNMQRTRPGEFYHWHVDAGPGAFSTRQLVAIWYLNDLSGAGGETEFHFQRVKIRPERGKLVLFPPFWTHPHRGVTPATDTKYIATTWVCYAQ